MITARSSLWLACFLLGTLPALAPPARAQNTAATPCCLSALRISAQPSVELLVSGPNGLETGYDTATSLPLHEIPSSNYVTISMEGDSEGSAGAPATRLIQIGMPAAGLYRVQAIAQSPGKFTVTFQATDMKGAVSQREFAGTAPRGGTYVYDVRYSPAAGAQLDVNVLAPLADLSAQVAAAAGPPPTFRVTGDFSLAAGSSGFDPGRDPVTIALASYTATFPRGTFTRTKGGTYRCDGSFEGIPLRAAITPEAGNQFHFTMEGEGIGLTAAINPLRLLLVAGQNAGSLLVNAAPQ